LSLGSVGISGLKIELKNIQRKFGFGKKEIIAIFSKKKTMREAS
jgi:hypothetical protein